MKRTHLPLNGLRVLDAAARHLSFTRAADELAVTPAAVGQQIRALEDLLGVVLFRRTPKGLELTSEAKAALPALRDGFLQFEAAVDAMQSRQSSLVYSIAAPREIAGEWLTGRLAQFRQDHPETRFFLSVPEPDDPFADANLDVAILFGEAPQGMEAVPLGSPGLICVTAPGYAGSDVIRWPGDVQTGDAALTVADAGMALDAAMRGLGIAHLPRLLAEARLAERSLVEHGATLPPSDSGTLQYWLCAPAPQWRQKKVKLLIAALAPQS